MAWLSNKSIVNYGKYKGLKVSDINDAKWVKNLHNSLFNIYFKKDVIDRLGINETDIIKTDSKFYKNKTKP